MALGGNPSIKIQGAATVVAGGTSNAGLAAPAIAGAPPCPVASTLPAPHGSPH